MVAPDAPSTPRPPKLVIFDADGTLVRPKSGSEFRKQASDWELLPRRAEALRALRDTGIRTALASNQGGVAFGIMPEHEVVPELFALARMLDIRPRAVYWCCMHPKATIERYRGESFFRKPNPGMLLAAMGLVMAEPGDTLMVGDRPEDEEAAHRAGCRFRHADDYFAERAHDDSER